MGMILTFFYHIINEKDKELIELGGEGQEIKLFQLDEITEINVFPNLRTYINKNRNKLKY